MRRPTLLVVVSATVILAACGGGSKPAVTDGGTAATPSTAPAPASVAPAAGGDQFGGDVCSALTKEEVAAATYPQGKATFDSTDTQQDEATGKAVVCQFLVTFGSEPSTVGVAISLMDDTEFGRRDEFSLMAPPSAVPGVGSEAWLVQPIPGQFEVWVSAAHGKFKLMTQAQDTSIALAKVAAGRD